MQPPRISLADEVYARLKRDFAEFLLVPGDRFTENEVAVRLQVSRTPVRQALLRLQQEGLVEVLFRNGWRVLPFDFDRLEQLYDMRILIEVEAIERICEGRIKGDPARSASIVDALVQRWQIPAAQRSTDAQQICDWDEQFHLDLVDAAGNAEMLRVHQDITNRIRVIRRLDFTRRPRIEATYDEHGKILQAIKRFRSGQAGLLLRTHIQSSQLEVRKITLHQLQTARPALNQGDEQKPSLST